MREGGGEQAVARLGSLEAGAGRGRQCGWEATVRVGGG